jgi:hypothetical protein
MAPFAAMPHFRPPGPDHTKFMSLLFPRVPALSISADMRDTFEYVCELPSFSNVLIVCKDRQTLGKFRQDLDLTAGIIRVSAPASWAVLSAAQSPPHLAVIEAGSGAEAAARPTVESACAWDA